MPRDPANPGDSEPHRAPGTTQSGGAELAPGVRVSDADLEITYASSSGPGGQNVNKRATKCLLRVPLAAIPISPAARARLAALAGRSLTDAGDILITSDEYRSQGRNRDACFERCAPLIIEARRPPRIRKPTAVPRWSKRARVNDKRRRGDVKRDRRASGDDA